MNNTPQRTIWARLLSWPAEMLATLKSIEARLSSIEQTQNKLAQCMDDRNHQRQMCLKTGHWNDPSSHY